MSLKAKIISWCGIALFGLLLAAILLPVLTFRPDRIRQASCPNNERQIGLAILQYVEDYDEEFPCGINKTGVGWAGTVQNYVKSTGVFHCPEDPMKTVGLAVPDSYGLNRNLLSAPLASLEGLPHTVMIFEITGDAARLDLQDEGLSAGAASFSAVGDGTDGSLVGGKGQAQYSTRWMGHRPAKQKGSQFEDSQGLHSGGSNFLFGDGHVKWFGTNRVSTGSDAKNKGDGQTGGLVGRAAGTENTEFQATFSTK